MIVISAGMQKSGSAYIYNLINDLLISSGYKDARIIKENYGLTSIMKWQNNNIGILQNKKILKLLQISFKEKKFVVKTHNKPSTLLNVLLRNGFAKSIYIYRDPRDVLISATDHGKKIIENGETHTFAEMVEFDIAFERVKMWIETYKSYKNNKNILCVKYEDLLSMPIVISKNICNYLKITVSENEIKSILQKYDRNNKNANMKNLHFNKAQIKRYEKELTYKQLSIFKHELKNQIRLMGYDI